MLIMHLDLKPIFRDLHSRVKALSILRQVPRVLWVHLFNTFTEAFPTIRMWRLTRIEANTAKFIKHCANLTLVGSVRRSIAVHLSLRSLVSIVSPVAVPTTRPAEFDQLIRVSCCDGPESLQNVVSGDLSTAGAGGFCSLNRSSNVNIGQQPLTLLFSSLWAVPSTNRSLSSIQVDKIFLYKSLLFCRKCHDFSLPDT